MMLTYTIGFIRNGDQVLMLNRNRPPFQGGWHGLGGKLEPGEQPAEGMAREILEEAGLLLAPEQLRYAGMVTWTAKEQTGSIVDGMYAFVADVDRTYPTPLEVTEGILDWKPIGWICSPSNFGVGEHVKRFLPMMLFEQDCYEYRCTFDGSRLIGFETLPLAAELPVS